MKKTFKRIAILLAGAMMICLIIGCNKKEKYTAEDYKKYFLTDNSVFIEVKTTYGKTKLETTNFRFVHKVNGNRVQYVEGNNTLKTYVYEFRDDGVYCAEKSNEYKTIKSIPDITDKLDSSEFDKVIIKDELKKDATWEENGSVYKIANIGDNSIDIEVTSKEKTKSYPMKITYSNEVGEAKVIIDDDNGKNIITTTAIVKGRISK